jgi:hypothetical protein
MLTLVLAAPAAATPLSFGSCVTSPAHLRCAAASPLALEFPSQSADSTEVAISPDGRSVYALNVASIEVFDRDGAGAALMPKAAGAGPARCVSQSSDGGICAAAAELDTPQSIAFNASGTRAYVVTSGAAPALLIFARDPATGGLTRRACLRGADQAGCTTVPALKGPFWDVTLSPGGETVYVAGAALTWLALDAAGDYAGSPGCLNGAGTPPCTAVPNLGGAISAARVAPDGEQVYAGSNYLWVFDRAAGGALTARGDTTRCLNDNGDNNCGKGRSVSGTGALEISSDGRNLYTMNYDELAIVDRNPQTGNISQPDDATACLIDFTYDGDTSCTAVAGIIRLNDLAISPNGDSVYASSDEIAVEGEMAHFLRDPQTGDLSQPASGGCLATHPTAAPELNAGTCTELPELLAALRIAMAPDGASLLVRTRSRSGSPVTGGLLLLDRDTPPICQDISVQIPFQTQAQVPLPCTDANGDSLSIGLSTQPAKGILGAVDSINGRVAFSPFTAATGADSFSFFATASNVASNTATAAIKIGDPPPPPPPGPVDVDGDGVSPPLDCNDSNPAIRPGAPEIPGNNLDEDCDNLDAAIERLKSGVQNGFRAFRGFTRISRLAVLDVPAGATVEVRCRSPKGKRGCPFKSRSFKRPKGAARLNLLKPFKKAHLPVRTVLEIRITKPGAIGKVVRYTMRPLKAPASKTLCTAPGSARARATC